MIGFDAIRELILPRGEGIQKSGAGFMVRCPTHPDRQSSLSISPGRTQPVVLNCHANNGCTPDGILAAFGLTWDAICKPLHRTDSKPQGRWMTCMRNAESGAPTTGHAVLAEYEYRDQNGTVIRGVSRCVQKCFRQWRPDATRRSGRTWTTRLDDGTEVGHNLVYRLPELLNARSRHLNLWIVEGEKDADRLWSLGYPATTNPQGAGKWNAGHSAWFEDADVMIVADRDDAGRNHALVVAESLISLARSVEILQAAQGKDVSDHLDAGLAVHKLVTVAEPKPAPSSVDGCPDCEVTA